MNPIGGPSPLPPSQPDDTNDQKVKRDASPRSELEAIEQLIRDGDDAQAGYRMNALINQWLGSTPLAISAQDLQEGLTALQKGHSAEALKDVQSAIENLPTRA